MDILTAKKSHEDAKPEARSVLLWGEQDFVRWHSASGEEAPPIATHSWAILPNQYTGAEWLQNRKPLE